MSRTLDVYLHLDLVGHLTQDDYGDISFEYVADWLNHPNALPLSHSLPLRSERFNRKECRGYFAGILPEGDKRQIIAKNLGISANNDFTMLERIGGECAGAVTFLPAGDELERADRQYRQLNTDELAKILRSLPKRPLMAGEQGVRLSLAGAQDKLPVRIQDGHIYLPLATSPSTHLLKPAIEQFESIVVNEALCMDLARRSGLQTAETFVRTVDDIEFLVVKRYDREVYESGEPVRVHQEDFCQALGLGPEHKYQNEGGPSLLQCVQLIRETSAVPAVDLAAFMDGVIFNYLVGNNDAHGKNFSLIHRPDASGGTRLAPFYDLVCTVYYPDLSSKMAMNLGGEYDCDKVMRRHFEKLASETGLGKAYMIRRTRESSEALLANLLPTPTEHPVAADIATLIRGRCEKTLVRLGA